MSRFFAVRIHAAGGAHHVVRANGKIYLVSSSRQVRSTRDAIPLPGARTVAQAMDVARRAADAAR